MHFIIIHLNEFSELLLKLLNDCRDHYELHGSKAKR